MHCQEKRVAALRGRGEYRATQHLGPCMDVHDGAAHIVALQKLLEDLVDARVPHPVSNGGKLRRVAVDRMDTETHRLDARAAKFIADGTLAAEKHDLATYLGKQQCRLNGNRHSTALDVAEVADDNNGPLGFYHVHYALNPLM